MAQELSWESIGERVKLSRLSVGMSQGEMAERIGLERSMVSKLESGVRHIDAVELTRIARELDYPLAHFLSAPPTVVSRRTATATELDRSEDSKRAYRTEARLSEWLRDVRQLMADGVLKAPPLLRFPGTVGSSGEAKEAAVWLREQLGLGAEPLGSMTEECERAGQYTAVVSLPEGADGASLVDDDVAVAIVNEHLQPGRQRSTAAHELGHLVLGDEFSSDLGVHASRRDREKAVDAFAAEFLLPTKVARRAVARKNPEEVRHNLVKLSATYKVSWTLAVHQAVPEGGRKAEFWQRMKEQTPTAAEFRNSLGWKPQPDLSAVRVPPGYASAVMRALDDDLITVVGAVEMMRGQVTPDDFDEE
ncbi:helix-turn-helix domain-containing protein [Nocardiopsis sp. HUAS JQ3]|uniref:helix-turn-helix domain-containing protein n=1 Tax=Nocardiopsis sp. HUAS JQ3 TaxID=3061629 RepID=UPI00349FDC1D